MTDSQWEVPSLLPVGLAPCHCTGEDEIHTPWMGQEVRVYRVWPESGLWHARYLDWFCCHGIKLLSFEKNKAVFLHTCCCLANFFKNIIIHRRCICNYFQGRTNLPPEKVPWDAIKTLLSQCIYGGKIDNEFDQVCNLSCIFMYNCIAECMIDSCIFKKAQVQL